MDEDRVPVDLASVDAVLATSRSVRRNLDFSRQIEDHVLCECIDLAAQAPTGAANGESWRFVVVKDPTKKKALATLYGEILEEFAATRGLTIKPTQRALVDRLHEIPAMILVCVHAPQPGPAAAEQVAYYGSVLPAAWSLMLALRARRIGSTWTTLLASRQEQIRALLDMPEDALLTVMLPVGYMQGARLRRAARKPAAEITFWDGWDNPRQR